MLSDEVAAKVLGELHQMTKHIDELAGQINQGKRDMASAAATIKQNSDSAVVAAGKAANAAIQESAARFELMLTQKVGDTLTEVAGAVVVRSALKWAAGFAALSLLIGVIAYQIGAYAGEKAGFAKAVDEKAATAWGNSPDGRLARRLADAGCQSARKFDHPTASNFDQGFKLISCAV